MQPSGVVSAIRELEQEGKKIQEIISALRKLQEQRSAPKPGGKGKGTRRRLSAKARRRISEAAKKRWAARRASKS